MFSAHASFASFHISLKTIAVGCNLFETNLIQYNSSHDGHQQFSLEGGRVHQRGDLEAVQKVQEVGHRPVGSCKHCRVPHGAGAQTGS